MTPAELEAPIREALEKTMRATLADQAAHRNWDYWAVRPLPEPGTRGHYPAGTKIHSDCSWGGRLVCFWTPGAPDPFRTDFAGSGNSSTACARLDHLDHPAQLQIGDPVTFGWNGNEHLALTLEPGTDPLVWSDGHQGAPNVYRLSWDRRMHQLLRLPVIELPPSPGEILSEMTGYWAWVKWRLAEGEWRHRHPLESDVRPNVPARIPLKWWAQYARFLANRDKPNKATSPVLAPSS